MQKFRYIVFALVVFLFLFVSVSSVLADGIQQAQKGLSDAAIKGYDLNISSPKDGKIPPKKGILTSLPGAIGQIIGAGLAFIGTIFFILMVYGGLLWMTARGNEQQTEKAKDLIAAAVIGIIIVFAAYMITAYIGTVL